MKPTRPTHPEPSPISSSFRKIVRHDTLPSSTAFLISPSSRVSLPFPFFTSTNTTLIVSPFSSFTLVYPSKTTKSIGFPMNRASAEEKGNSGKSGAICSEILPFSVERERLTESFRISVVHSSFQRSRSFCARPSIALICWRKTRYAATMPRRKAMAGMRRSVRVIRILIRDWPFERYR